MKLRNSIAGMNGRATNPRSTYPSRANVFGEPTSALDPGLHDEVLNVMRELAHTGMTMIVVIHEVQFAQEAADRVILLKGGMIHADATSNEVVKGSSGGGLGDFCLRP